MDQNQRLTIEQTHTGYWTVQRGRLQVASARTRKGAEAELELVRRLSVRRGILRVGRRFDAPAAR